MLNHDNADYLRFTGPRRLDKQVHTLEVLLYGIGIDGVLDDAEVATLTFWLNENVEHFEHHPFSKFVPMLREMPTAIARSSDLKCCVDAVEDGFVPTGTRAFAANALFEGSVLLENAQRNSTQGGSHFGG